MTLGSLFSGSGSFELAGVLNGITPIWNSEIDPFCLKVEAARFPTVKQLGDVTRINGGSIDPVDIITFGSPCQNMSIAGDRTGLAGEQSSLFYEAVRIIKEMREATNGKYPKYCIWENVTGAFTSNRGEDFHTVIKMLSSICVDNVSIPRPQKWQNAGCVVGDGWSIAWRVYDAQYWGSPQRRKRIYALIDLIDERAGEILFKQESSRRYSPPSRETWQAITDSLSLDPGAAFSSVAVFDSRGNGDGVTVPTIVGDHENRITDYTALIFYQAVTFYHFKESNVCPTLCARDCHSFNHLLTWEDAFNQRRVRRLTPIECLRLQGLPDWWIDGVSASDSAIYKMAGNGISLSCAFDVLERITQNE